MGTKLLWTITLDSRWLSQDCSTMLRERQLHPQLPHPLMHQQRDQPTDQRIQRPLGIQTTTVLEETLRPAYPSAQRRMLTSTRRVCMTAWRTVERQNLFATEKNSLSQKK